MSRIINTYPKWGKIKHPLTTTRLLSTGISDIGSSSDKTIVDPAMRQYKYWNREEYSRKGRYDYLIKISPESIVKEANILSLSDPNDDANICLNESLPFGSRLIGTGTTLKDFDKFR